MITAIDFGCSRIRSAFRSPDHRDRLSLFVERAEYAMIRDTQHHRQALESRQIPFAICRDSLAVVGNRAMEAQWLSRVPTTPLFTDGAVPSDDPPARQMLHVLVSAMLPEPSGSVNLCALTIPGAHNHSEQTRRNCDFLTRLVQMQGYRAMVVNAAEAAVLATCGEATFTGASIVMGAETTEICIARLGVPLAANSLPVGSNWIDAEIARDYKIQLFDAGGSCYLDLESVREWKAQVQIDVSNPLGERECVLSRLYTVVLDRVVRSLGQLLTSPQVQSALQGQRLSIVLCGGAVKTGGFANLFTERLIEQDLAERILAVRTAPDADIAVVRGALIVAELEAIAERSATRAAFAA